MSGMGTYNTGVFNVSLKFKSQKSSYKQDTEFRVIGFVNNAQDLLLFTYLYVLYWYNFNQMVHLC